MNNQVIGLRSAWKMVVLCLALTFYTAIVASAKYSGGSGTENDPYQISSIADLDELAGSSEDWDKHFVLTADIDFGGAGAEQVALDISPEGDFQGTEFTGVFDGAGHVLRNGNINKPNTDYVGLFGKLGSGGETRNLGVKEINVSGDRCVGDLVGYNKGKMSSCYATGAVSGNSYAGGLVGINFDSATITYCYATGAVLVESNHAGGLVGYNKGKITSCYATDAVSGGKDVGGLSGGNLGTITSCYATGSVTSKSGDIGGLVGNNYGKITSCYAMGTVSGNWNVGGLVEYNDDGTIISRYATSAVSGDLHVGGLVGHNDYGKITSCYATGAVSGNGDVGGLVGLNDATITSCYWDVDASGLIESVGGKGRTTDQMTYPYASDTFVDWDFESTWTADIDGRNGGYPYLQ